MNDRCPRCDRDTCTAPALRGVRPETFDSVLAYNRARRECDAHAVDWRARALKAEDECELLAQRDYYTWCDARRMWCMWFAEAWRAIGYAEAAYVQLEDAIAAYNRQRK